MCESARTMSYLGDLVENPDEWRKNPKLIPFRISQEDYEKFTSEIPKKTPVAKVEKIREY